MSLHRLIPAAGLALLSAACGQKGPLYLPDKNAQVITSPAAAPAPADPGAAPAATPPPAPGGTPSKPDDKNDQDSQPPQ